LSKNTSSENGKLNISIVPGIGTTDEDLLELEGARVRACGSKADCQVAIVSDGMINFESLPYDMYYVYRDYSDYNLYTSHPPMSIAELQVYVESEFVYSEAKGLRGIGSKISIVDSSNQLIPADQIYLVKYCSYYTDSNNCPGDLEEPAKWSDMYSNPLEFSSQVSSEDQVKEIETSGLELKLKYGDQNQWFIYNPNQGYNEFTWQFD